MSDELRLAIANLHEYCAHNNIQLSVKDNGMTLRADWEGKICRAEGKHGRPDIVALTLLQELKKHLNTLPIEDTIT